MAHAQKFRNSSMTTYVGSTVSECSGLEHRPRSLYYFLGRSSSSYSASLHPGAQMGTSQFKDGCAGHGTGDIPSMV